MEDADASGQELEEESPTQHKFVRFRGKNWDELLKVYLFANRVYIGLR